MIEALTRILIVGATLSALWMLIASGFTLLYGVAEIINMAYGAFYALGAYMLYTGTILLEIPPLISLILSIFVVLIIGLAVYRFTIQPIQHLHGTTIIVTFILLILFVESLRLIYGPQPVSTGYLIKGTALIFGVKVELQRLLILPVSLATLLFLWWLLTKTDLGRAIRAVSQDRDASALMGINVQRIFLITMAISTILAALAGCLIAPLRAIEPGLVWSPFIPMFAVPIFGGLGSMAGSIMASFVMGYSEIAIAYAFGSRFRGIVPILVILVMLQIRPQGLLGRRRT